VSLIFSIKDLYNMCLIYVITLPKKRHAPNLRRSVITCLSHIADILSSLFYVVRRKYIFHRDRKLIRAQVTADLYICR